MAHSGFGNVQGKVWLSGQLSAENSLREVLEVVGGMQGTRFGLLRILSKAVRGYVGIIDGRTITGAQVTSTREFGLPALRKLFAAQKGLFVVMQMTDLPSELQQGLNFPIALLLNHKVNDQIPPAISDALESLAAANPQLFMMNEAATAAATSGTDLAKFESYMAWGRDSEQAAPSTNLAKITSSMMRPNAEQIAAARAALQQEQEQQRQQTQQQAAPPPEPPPPSPPPPRLTPKLSRLKHPGVNADDQQSMSQKIRTLREEQAATQKLDAIDADLIDDGPIETLSPAQKRKRDLLSLASSAIGLLLFLVLGQQVFNVTQGHTKYASGVRALASGDSARAQVELSTALKLGGSGPHAYLYRSLAEAKLGHKERAVSDMNQMINQHPKDSLARVGRALMYLKSKDYPSAISDADEILKQDDHYFDAYRIKALANCSAGHMKECIDDATSYLRYTEGDKNADRGRSEIFATRGFALLKVKKYDQAVSDYNNAIELTSKSAKLYSSRAVAFSKLKEWDHALEDAETAIKLDPSNAGLYKLRGLCYEQAGEAAKAASDMDTAAKMKPSLNAFRLRGLTRLAAKDYEGALEDFEYLLSVDPNDKEAKRKYDEARNRLGLKLLPTSAGNKAQQTKG